MIEIQKPRIECVETNEGREMQFNADSVPLSATA